MVGAPRQCCGGSVFAAAGRTAAEDRQPDRRVVEDEPLELPAGEGQAARRLDRDDLGDPGQAVDHRHLAEEVAGAEPGELLAVADDPDARPRSTTKKPVPISPWRAITWSAGKSTSIARSPIAARSSRRHAAEQRAAAEQLRSGGRW